MKFKFPTPYSVLMIVILLAVWLTYLLPSGKYDTIFFDKNQNHFVIQTSDSTYSLPAEQSTLSKLNINISFEIFAEGKIKKPISIPNTYKKISAEEKNLSQFLFAPIKGIYDGIDVILFVLILGGFIGVFNSSGALNQGVGFLAYQLKNKEGILIILVTSLIAMGGTSFGLAEETLAFYPILIPVFLAAGYDLLVPVAVIYLGSSVGSMASTINPFAVIIASDSAGVSWTTGIESRIIALILGLIITIAYILRYAEKVRKNPELSLVYGTPLPSGISTERAEPVSQLKTSTKIQLMIFASSFLVMIFGVSSLGWWFEEMTALFLVASVVIAIVQKISEEQFINEFIGGARDLLGVAFIIGIARGVTFILNEGKIADTLLFYASSWVEGMSPALFLPMLLVVFAILTLFIASSSGMAVVTMPIIGGLAAVIGVGGENVVNAYMFGMGIMGIITPTGLILPSLTMVNVSYQQWLKFVTPLLIALTFLCIATLLGNFYL